MVDRTLDHNLTAMQSIKGKTVKKLRNFLLPFVKSALNLWMKDRVYVARSGYCAGLLRRGGYDYLPRRETSEFKYLKSLDLEGKTVYDIGGYIGLRTMFFAQRVGSNGRVFTFEPNPDNYQKILDHLSLNNLSNARVFQIGLGEGRETLQMWVDDQNTGRGTADSTRRQKLKKSKHLKVIDIEVDSLDHQISENRLPFPDFIKIDVEGMEMAVLRGMPHLIESAKPSILIELHGNCDIEMVGFLLEKGYRIYQIEDSVEITPDNLDAIHGHIYAY